MVKINWDTTLDTTNKKVGVGIMMRDGKGSFLAALSKQVSIDVTPVVAEIIAALHAVMWCIEQGFKRVVFEGDSLQVVNEVNSIHPCDSLYGHLIEDIKTGIQTLDVAIFSHVKREAKRCCS
jgi:ribonuclease HI